MGHVGLRSRNNPATDRGLRRVSAPSWLGVDASLPAPAPPSSTGPRQGDGRPGLPPTLPPPPPGPLPASPPPQEGTSFSAPALTDRSFRPPALGEGKKPGGIISISRRHKHINHHRPSPVRPTASARGRERRGLEMPGTASAAPGAGREQGARGHLPPPAPPPHPSLPSLVLPTQKLHRGDVLLKKFLYKSPPTNTQIPETLALALESPPTAKGS